MIKQTNLEGLGYDDILLIPQSSTINSRDEVNLYNIDGIIPIFSAPMKNISEPNLVIELCNLGGIGILHRFFEKESDRYDAVTHIANNCKNFGISIGINELAEEEKFVSFASNNNCKYVVVDTASGYIQKTIDAIRWLSLKKKLNRWNFKIIAGNVIDSTGCLSLAKAGADIIRINIGTGLQCLTSKSIGIGFPPLTAIKECCEIKRIFPYINLIADGGIYNPGQALKALSFGADGVMVGSLFGRAKEADNQGVIFGMSSYHLQERMNKTKKSNEGTVTIIPSNEIQSLKDIFTEFCYGLKSGMSYLGCDDINKLHNMTIEYIIYK